MGLFLQLGFPGQTPRQTDLQAERQTDERAYEMIGKWQASRPTIRQTSWHAGRQMDRRIGRRAHMWLGRKADQLLMSLTF